MAPTARATTGAPAPAAAEAVAGERPEDAVGAPSAGEPPTSSDSDAAAAKGDGASVAAGDSASARGKRKVGPESTDRGKSESSRKAALSGTASSGTSSSGTAGVRETPHGEGSSRAEAEAEASRLQAEKGSKSEGAGEAGENTEGCDDPRKEPPRR